MFTALLSSIVSSIIDVSIGIKESSQLMGLIIDMACLVKLELLLAPQQ